MERLHCNFTFFYFYCFYASITFLKQIRMLTVYVCVLIFDLSKVAKMICNRDSDLIAVCTDDLMIRVYDMSTRSVKVECAVCVPRMCVNLVEQS